MRALIFLLLVGLLYHPTSANSIEIEVSGIENLQPNQLGILEVEISNLTDEVIENFYIKVFSKALEFPLREMRFDLGLEEVVSFPYRVKDVKAGFYQVAVTYFYTEIRVENEGRENEKTIFLNHTKTLNYRIKVLGDVKVTLLTKKISLKENQKNFEIVFESRGGIARLLKYRFLNGESLRLAYDGNVETLDGRAFEVIALDASDVEPNHVLILDIAYMDPFGNVLRKQESIELQIKPEKSNTDDVMVGALALALLAFTRFLLVAEN